MSNRPCEDDLPNFTVHIVRFVYEVLFGSTFPEWTEEKRVTVNFVVKRLCSSTDSTFRDVVILGNGLIF